MSYNPSAYFVTTYFPVYFQTAAKTVPVTQVITKTRSGRGFKTLSETFTSLTAPADNYLDEDAEILLLLAML
jgi:hypothetical protein